MRIYGIYVLVLVVLLIGSDIASANDIYIAQTATGSGDGTSCSNPHAVSFFNSVGNWGTGTNKIGPGTTVHLCGIFNAPAGSNYLTFQASGTEGNPITLKWESGAIVQSPYFSHGNQGSGGGILANGKSYLVIDGGTNGILRNTENGSGLTYQKSSTGIEIYRCNNTEIKNLAISNIYVRRSGDTIMDHGNLNFINSSGSNIEIHHNIMHDAGWGINWAYSNGDHDILVHHNDIYNIDHGFSPYGDQGGTADSVYFYNNHVHDYSNWDYSGYHHDGVHSYGVNGSKLRNIYIYNNRFDGHTGTTMTGHIFLEGNGDSTPWTDYSGKARIFNNVFIADSEVNGIVQVYRGTNNEIYNNTIIGGGISGSTCFATSDTINITFKNNFIAGCGTLIYAFAEATRSITSDYNLYANCSGTGCWYVGSTETGSWSGYREGQPTLDVHSINAIGSATGGLTTSGVPLAGSSIINAATNLSSAGYTALNSDIDGVSRPQGSAWDIGAYEFYAASTSKQPNPPFNIFVK